MELFTKQIEKQLQAQFGKGADMDQKVICKIFDPYGSWKWFIMNQDPKNPDYLWGIVKGYEVETGSISKRELEGLATRKIGQLEAPLERDLHFSPMPAKEVWDKLNAGKFV
jgi:hypothetical protein